MATSAAYRRALVELAPADTVLYALEIRHPDLATPVRVVHDVDKRTIETHEYAAAAFRVRLAADVDRRAPQVEIGVDNVGRILTQWLDASHGGAGATVRVMQVLAATSAVEWEITVDVMSVRVTQREVAVRLGYAPLFARAAVTARYDPTTFPGLF